jgi:cell division protein ZapA (FtsZ GTPase activity inhibitor)
MAKRRIQDRLDQHSRELTKHDREIAAIRKLILTGMRLVNKTAATQARTEKNLEALINSLRRGSNGHAKRRIDIN